MQPEFLVIVIFAALALWLGVGIFSSRLGSEIVCSQCGEQVVPAMSRRGVQDVAVCGACGFSLGGAPVAASGLDTVNSTDDA
jgi:predicted RNA-binding Zn-ribbon protein involved in translation (DUF1610 family)